jgi:glycosyltransferase involved in cell wall biosynthesis
MGGSPIRVVMLIDKLLNPSGAERFAIGLASELAARGFDVTLCATRKVSPQVAADLGDAGVRLLVLGRRSTLDLRPLVGLIGRLRSERVEVLHGHMLGSSVWAALLGKVAGVPVVIAQEHGTLLDSRRHRFAYGGIVGRFATRYVSVSAAARDRLIHERGVPADKTVVIPAAYIPRSDDSGGSGTLREELAIAPSAKVIGTIASIRPVKALDVLLDAHAILAARHPDAHLLIAGDGPSRAELEQHAIRAGTADRVHFVGFREQIGVVLRTIDIGVLSSDSEGTPLFVLECMAAGVPVVSTDVGGLPEIVESGISGLLVPSQDPQALAAAIGQLLDDPELAHTLAQAAARRIPSLTMSSIADRFEELYRSELGDRASGVTRAPHRPPPVPSPRS